MANRLTKGETVEGRVFGYARVSSREQNPDRQIDALLEFGVPTNRIYTDKASGKDFKRPEYQKLMRRIKPGDVLVTKSIDRLGRDYNELLEEWRRVTKSKQAAIVVLDMPLLDTRQTQEGVTAAFVADLTLQLLSYVAQIERENIRQRQAEGIEAAKARGVRFGRPKLEKPKHFAKIRDTYQKGEITRKEAARLLGISTATFDRWRKEEQSKHSASKAL